MEHFVYVERMGWDNKNETAKRENRRAKIAVWWDMMGCPVPEGYDARRVRRSIERAFKNLSYYGPVSMTGYGDQKQTSCALLRGLSSTGVDVAHAKPESVCSLMYSDMVEWRAHNPPPATMMLISDKVYDVFAWDLARLQQDTQYNLFLASPSKPPKFSVLHASARWAWESLLVESRALSTPLSAKFYCKPCCFQGQSPAGFRKHISSKRHAVQEVLNPLYKELDYVTSQWGKNYAAKPEYATAQIAVWWDMMDCPIPEGYDARRVRPSIEAGFKELGYSGPVSITAYGDLNQAPDHLLRGLSSTGVALAHTIPQVIYTRMLSAMAEWRSHNPPPATIMFISDDLNRLFSDNIARHQQENKYNLFMAYSYRPPKMSFLVTSAEWLWESLLLAGAHRWRLEKCSQSSTIPRDNSTEMFFCTVCWDGVCKSLDDFTNHLSSEEHAQTEAYIYACRRENKSDLRWGKKDQVLRNFPESKRVRKAHRTGFGHLHYHLHVTKRTRARKYLTSKKD